MKLTYRGVAYDYTPPEVSTTAAPVTGRYRGIDVRFRNPAKPLVLQPTLDLKYRNVAYRTGDATPAAVVQTERPSVASRARAQMVKHHVVLENRERVSLSRAAQSIGLNNIATMVSHIRSKMRHDTAKACEPSQASMS